MKNIKCPRCGFPVLDTLEITKFLICPKCGMKFYPIKKEIPLNGYIDDHGDFVEL